MRVVANYAMKGKMQATIASSVFAFLSLFLMPSALVSAGIIALVTLRIHPSAGLGVLIWSLIALYLGHLALDHSAVFVGMIVLILGSSLGLSMILRQTGSLDKTVLVAVGVALVSVVGFHVLIDNVTQFWMQWLDGGLKENLAANGMAIPEELWQILAQGMTGLLASVLLLFVLLSVFIGRYWQALLFNPQGFSREFHALQLGKGLAMLNVVILIIAFMQDWPASLIAVDLLSIMTLAFTLHGLAIAHFFVAQKQLSSAWFYGIYPLVVLIPQAMMMVASVGFMDAWFRLRERFSPPAGPNLNKD
jgi:hypothetical protein